MHRLVTSPGQGLCMPRHRQPASLSATSNSSPEVIRLVVMMYVKYPLSLRNVEDLQFERGIDISHETVRYWWNRLGPMFAADIRRQRASCMRRYRHGSGTSTRRCRSSPRSTPTSTTTSTPNVTSSIEQPTRFCVRPPWPSGAASWPDPPHSKTEFCQSEICAH